MAYDPSLLICLVDRWSPETHTFHFPWGEMAPTLQDVSLLLGLPLAGEAVGPLEYDDLWHQQLQARFVGVRNGADPLPTDAHGVRYKWLRQYQVNPFVCCYICMHECTIVTCLT